jgi:CHAT domain
MAHQYPDLARRYERLRDEVNTPTRGFDQDGAGVWAHRRKAMAHLDACVMEIRNIPGQERFLLGQTTAEMQECAAGGTIVVVNIASFRSDAILVSTAGIQALNLPKLSASDAKVWLDRKWTGRRAERPQKNKEYLEYLSWLWEACVKQILDKVYNSHDTASGLPRIWWIGTGLASSMPFHAAGIHSSGSTENALSRAISSYVPSIKALGYSRHRAKATDPTGGTLLITTMPTTPGNGHGLGQNSRKPSELPGVVEEKRWVVGAAGGHLKIESLDLPSVGQVVDRLENCCIAHFACHGYTDHSDPSNSGLILQKCVGGQDEQDRLTVRRVSELRLKKARVAYLSACSTAENKAAQLSDEVIHVVSGFQMAGFPHVVGCLWPSIDAVCVEVASGFYSLMLGKELGGWVGRGVASALREAVLEVRAREMGSPLTWAPFVHYGA